MLRVTAMPVHRVALKGFIKPSAASLRLTTLINLRPAARRSGALQQHLAQRAAIIKTATAGR
jgi:hypothetical protein